jgi:uncharacterized membrane protein AbrB (regulator of aidB expression)
MLNMLENGVIARTLITLLVVGVWCYLLVTGQAVPDTFHTVTMLVIGWYFGSDTPQSVIRSASGRNRN